MHLSLQIIIEYNKILQKTVQYTYTSIASDTRNIALYPLSQIISTTLGSIKTGSKHLCTALPSISSSRK